ncbi:MAG: metallophosphoesterase [Capsulimonadales bacterium]|nr:metallophosphoesterase [Capsulimonadales bacterium]
MRRLRLVHLSDIHLQPERDAAAGFAACLRHLQALDPPPDLIINTGDTIMDGVGVGLQRANVQWELWDSLVHDHCRIPMLHCLGNHDIWGWNRRKSGCTGSEPFYGKELPLRRLGLSSPYYHKDLAGWRIFVLDSIFDGAGDAAEASTSHFVARLDDTQLAWLVRELAATPPETNVILVSHCPIVGGAALFFTGEVGETERTGHWVIPNNWMHIDARALVAILMRFPNVRLCLSGHTHMHDRMEFAGITFINNGALSGRWWRNDAPDPPPTYSPPGYGLLELFDDGSFTNRWLPFTVNNHR